MDTSDYTALIGLALAAAGLFYTAIQTRDNTRTRRGALFKEMYEGFLLDDELGLVFEMIEAKVPFFTPNFGAQDAEEARRRQMAVEHLFAHFEVICSLHRRGLLTDEDMNLDLNYIMRRVIKYPGFHAYEESLENWRATRDLERGPYDNFFDYARRTLTGPDGRSSPG